MDAVFEVDGCAECEARGRMDITDRREGNRNVRSRVQREDAAVDQEIPRNGSFLRIRFDGAGGASKGCRWLLELAGGVVPALVYEINTWARSRAKLCSGATVELENCGVRRMELRIVGNGRDGRCRWCRTFRSGLKTAVRREYGRKAFIQEGRCVFDIEKNPC